MNDQPMFDVISGMFGLISGMFGLISGMFGLISGMFGLNRSSIEPGIRYSCYPLVVVFNILSWYRFHCRGMTKHLWIYPLKMVIFHSKLLVYRRVMMVSSGDEWNHLLVIKRGWLENQRNGGNAWSLLTTHQQSSSGQG